MLLFMDGMAHYDASQLGVKYSSFSSVDSIWSIVPEGRLGGSCLKRQSTTGGASSGYVGVAPFTTRLGYWTPTASGVCGFALKVDDLTRLSSSPSTFSGIPTGLVSIAEGDAPHLQLMLENTGTFALRLGQTVIARSIEGLQSASWAYIECKWVLHDTTGSFVLRVNGIPILTFAGDTRLGGLGIWNSVRLLRVQADSGSPPLVLRMSDLYVADLATASSSDVSDFLGDGVIATILPNGPGNSTAWTPSTPPNWDTVNDTPAPDGDGTTIQTTAPGTRDTYAFQDLATSAVVKGVQVCLLARKVEDGASALAPVVRQSGTDYLGPTQGVASIAYDRYLTQAYDLNPATGAKFTAAEVNAGEFGVQKTI